MEHISKLNVCEDALIIGGVTVSLTMIQTVLGIIILSVQVILILWKAGVRIYNAIKKKDIKEITNTLEDTQSKLEDLKDKTDGKQH